MDANVKLSPQEMALVTDAGFILTKQAIIDKVYVLFGQLAGEFTAACRLFPGLLPAEVLQVPPKISRGEQYRQLPYVMLDYPRYFTKEATLAIRCFFWWGHFFSIQLHVSGNWKKRLEPGLAQALQNGLPENWYYCVAKDEWQHTFGEENFLPVSMANQGACLEHLYKQHFIKLAQKIPLQEWDHAYAFYTSRFHHLLEWYGRLIA